jgi:hypothetical protein
MFRDDTSPMVRRDERTEDHQSFRADNPEQPPAINDISASRRIAKR